MGVASLVLGIIAAVVSFIPFCGTWAFIPAIVGLVLGIVDLVKKNKEKAPKGKAIAGIVCSSVAIVIICIYWLILGVAANKAAKTLESTDWNEVFSGWNVTIDE